MQKNKLNPKPLIVIIFFAMCFTITTLFAQFSGGSGEQADPYQITSRADMEELADSVDLGPYWSNHKYFSLENDITDVITTIIGKSTVYALYNAHFYGNNHSINVAINSNNKYIGVFGNAHASSIIGLKVYGYINGYGNNDSYVAGIVGYAWDCIISNNENYANVTSNFLSAGIVGHSSICTIDSNLNTGSITSNIVGIGTYRSDMSCSGIASYVGDGSLHYNHNTGIINGINCSNVGGIVGYLSTSNMYFCTNIGIIKATNSSLTQSAGGVVSCAASSFVCEINSCVNKGLVSATYNVGGIVGILGQNLVKCINAGVVEGETNVGAIAGIKQNSYSTIIDCFYDIQMCKLQAVNNQPHIGVQGKPTVWIINELLKY